MQVNDKLAALRKVMAQLRIDAVIVPSSDPHQSEYVAECWKDREWISGFTGSSGVVVVTRTVAGLWTDSRYFLQAEAELKGSDVQLFRVKNQFAPEHIDWLRNNLPQGSVVSIDGEDISKSQYDLYASLLSENDINLKTTDLVSPIWSDRPALPSGPAMEHPAPYAGHTRLQKLSQLRATMAEKGANHCLLTALDDIAWTFNIRGNDVSYNPVVVAFALIDENDAILFTDGQKFGPALIDALEGDGVVVKPYDQVIAWLNSLDAKDTLMLEPASTNTALYKAVNAAIIHADSPARIAKGVKEAVEIEHLKAAMVRDGRALCMAFKWLEDHLGMETITEASFALKIAEFRRTQPDYMGESFGAIVGYRGNGAIVHYHPDTENSAVIKAEGILLVDCGGQYLGGTTDITRTIALSEQSHAARQHYTLVLKGHINLARAIFPEGSCGAQLDVLARQFLWQYGLNYLHGTGHGIGYFLNVHEGPHGIAAASTDRGRTPLLPGMVISNEPGFYLENEYGIRIENVIVVARHQTKGFLLFDTVSLFPFDLSLIDTSLLDGGEKAWINHYHEEVYAKLSEALDEAHISWLRKKCATLP